MTRSVLLIEDNPDLAHLLPLHLQDLNCSVEAVRDGMIGLKKALTAPQPTAAAVETGATEGLRAEAAVDTTPRAPSAQR